MQNPEPSDPQMRDAQSFDLEGNYRQKINADAPHEAVEDIYVSHKKGSKMLMARKGLKLSAAQVQTLKQLGHDQLTTIKDKVAKLDHVLKPSNQLSATGLAEDISAVISETFHDASGAMSEIVGTAQDIIASARFDNTMLNKLTLFKERHGALFPFHLSSTVVSTLLGVELGYSRQKLGELLTATLFRDIGLLHLPEITAGPLTDDERKIFRVHPYVSGLILQDTGLCSAETITGVAQHHARLDGLGYPDSLRTDKVGEFGRILGIADSFCSMLRCGQSMDHALWSLEAGFHDSKLAEEERVSAYDHKIVSIIRANKALFGDSINTNRVDSADTQPYVEQTCKALGEIRDELLQCSALINDHRNKSRQDVPRFVDTIQLRIQTVLHYIYEGTGIVESALDQEALDNISGLMNDTERLVPELYRHAREINTLLERHDDFFTGEVGYVTNMKLLYEKALALYERHLEFTGLEMIHP